ncbi:MAG TPA: type 4a pilus biogenesis protein PilO [bacterium]|nr:type 4a pilus biogenesis protein PilO [bacterium]HPN30506.1 type 4a pilus biogenesis protein PilO [bacterium]
MKISDKELKKLMIICFVCFFILWKVYVLNPAQKKIAVYDRLIGNTKTDFVQLKNSHTDLLEKKMEFILNKEKNKELEFYLIKDKQQILTVINDIFNEAKNNKIFILNSSAGAKVLSNGYYMNNFLNLTVQADYNNFLKFASKISEYKYMIQINDLDIKKNDNSNMLSVKISFMGFSQE